MVYFLPLFLFASCSGQISDPSTVEKVDLEKYAGKWYDIAHIPARFLKNCECVTAEYEIGQKNTVKVINNCRKSDSGKNSSITGKAFIVKNSNNAKLKVQFFWPFRGDYWIFELDEDYQYAAVGSPSGNYLWILSRTPVLSKEVYSDLLEKLKKKGFDVERLVMVNHENCE
jgi:apolipoprotein D and lipocalin family protein